MSAPGTTRPCWPRASRGLIDCLARGLAEERQRRRQRIDMFALRTNLDRIGRQCRMPSCGLNRAFGDTAECRDPFGEQIDKFFGGLGHLVEELVERDEVRPLTFQWACLGGWSLPSSAGTLF